MYSKKFWDAFFGDAQDLFDDFDKSINKVFGKIDDNEKNDKKSYYHYISDKYENGMCVEHHEKIVDNGKVVKDEHKSIEEKKEETRTIGSEVVKAKNKEIENLKSENEKLKTENESLKAKIAQIKNMFN